MSTRPASWGKKPAMMLSRVVLPQPLGPRMPSTSPERTAKLMSCKASTRWPFMPKLLPTPLHREAGAGGVALGRGVAHDSLRTLLNSLSPPTMVRSQRRPITRDEQDAHDDDVHPAQHARIHDGRSQAVRHPGELAQHQIGKGDAQAQPEAGDHVGHGRRDEHRKDELGLAQAHHGPGPEIQGVHRPSPGGRAQIDGEKGGQGDQEHGGLEADAEPHQGQGQPGDARHRPHPIDKGVQKQAHEAQTAGDEPQGQAQGHGIGEAAAHPAQAGQGVAHKTAGIGRAARGREDVVPGRVPDLGRRGQQIGRHQAPQAEQGPQAQGAGGQQPGQKHGHGRAAAGLAKGWGGAGHD